MIPVFFFNLLTLNLSKCLPRCNVLEGIRLSYLCLLYVMQIEMRNYYIGVRYTSLPSFPSSHRGSVKEMVNPVLSSYLFMLRYLKHIELLNYTEKGLPCINAQGKIDLSTYYLDGLTNCYKSFTWYLKSNRAIFSCGAIGQRYTYQRDSIQLTACGAYRT